LVGKGREEVDGHAARHVEASWDAGVLFDECDHGWEYRSLHRQGRGRREYLRLGGGRATMPLMLRTDEAARHKLTVPTHVAQTLTGWAVCAVFELRKTPEEVLEAQWSCVNEELRAFTGGLLAE
jgi:hypothetical protein